MPQAFPPWLKTRFPASNAINATQEVLKQLGLHTVCQSAHCPNLGRCFGRGTATFMILGDVCTRHCRFCAVNGGRPGSVDPDEPARVAEAVRKLGLHHAVITSVTRDDLADGGAGQFAATIQAIREQAPGAAVEVLTPDFAGETSSAGTVVSARPEIYSHNIETVPRLYSRVRPGADYRRSLQLLAWVKEREPGIYTKSGLMVGLGETPAEVRRALQDLRAVGCDIVTIGQYLRPSPAHLEVVEYIPPATFNQYRLMGEEMGFLHVSSGPFVRSSYDAHEFWRRLGNDRSFCHEEGR